MTPELRESFRNARYDLFLPAGTVQLEVDRESAQLGAWLRLHACTSAALLTAHNPGGTQRADSLNTAAQAQLAARLHVYRVIHAMAIDPSGSWPPESGFLVAGISQPDALALASEFGQVAILWFDADAIPRLVEIDQAAR